MKQKVQVIESKSLEDGTFGVVIWGSFSKENFKKLLSKLEKDHSFEVELDG